MTAPVRVVPRCGRIGCNLDDHDRTHSHADWAEGDVVVVEPKRSTSPGYAWGCPAGVVMPPAETASEAAPHGTVTVLLDFHGRTHVPADLLVRWHTVRRRAYRQPGARLMPRLSRLHQIDPAFRVVEPPLWSE